MTDDLEPEPKVLNAPERIWLQTGEPLTDCPFAELDDVTWCANKIDDSDIEYVRADAAVAAELDAERWRELMDVLAADVWVMEDKHTPSGPPILYKAWKVLACHSQSFVYEIDASIRSRTAALTPPKEPQYFTRRNKKYYDGRQFELVKDINPNGPISDKTYIVVGRFPTHEEAVAALASMPKEPQ